MTAEVIVDASLSGLEQGQLITLPELPNLADWEKFEEAGRALAPNLTRQHSAFELRTWASFSAGATGFGSLCSTGPSKMALD